MRALADVVADLLEFVYQTKLAEEDRRMLALGIASAPDALLTEREATEEAALGRLFLATLASQPVSEQAGLRRDFRTDVLAGRVPDVPANVLNLFRRLEASAPPLR